MERGNPTKERMAALHDLIDRLFEGEDVLRPEKELEETKEKGTTKWA